MEFRIADTFTESLARLTGDEQKSVKMTAFDLQLNPAHPSLQLHKLDKAKDKRFWSIRVSSDVRLIVHRTDASLLLCYVDHHDKAYEWAERRKVEAHPKTGAAQLVEIRETVQEILVPKYVESVEPAKPKPALFAKLADDLLLSYGVPPEWLHDVRAANEDTLFVLADHLPAEAAEALLDLATGVTPKTPQPTISADPFAHPDAQRRFRIMSDVEELARALDYPWDKWTVFLHPAQRAMVERGYNGPARVAGSAGTGKTIVALHRAVHLAKANPNARVLLGTFSESLANALRAKLRRLISNQPRLGERIEVYSLDALALRLYELNFGKLQLTSPASLRLLIQEAAGEVSGHKFGAQFLLAEWGQVVDAWQLTTWEAYRDVARLGRKTRLKEAQRALLWSIFERVRARLARQKLVSSSDVFGALTSKLQGGSPPPFDFIVLDEAQDVSIPQLRYLAALGAGGTNALFFSGDLGQRIFQQPFSWKALGVDVRGRSITLKVNYRTSHQIREHADRLLSPEVSDVDGNTESRSGTVSTFNGPRPSIQISDSTEDEIDFVSQWIKTRLAEGVSLEEIAIVVRSDSELGRAESAAKRAGASFYVLDERVALEIGKMTLTTMHLAKGLEFRAVAVMACDDGVIPLQSRIESVADEADLEDVYNTERHLLYVACTRARDSLLVSASKPASEFVDDLADAPNY
ncbi:MAG TPA: 3'-5' exonuclease [Bryobacteraceae bacterium]|jgi:superfamily I DNA/RNA helicase